MANEYKQTMNLPKTGFPMRAGLSKSEPKRLKDWQDNKVYERTDKEEKSYVRYRVDICNNRSTSEAAMQVDAALSKLCLVRILCKDTPDPSGMKHKVMRYEGIIDMESEQVFWPD